MEKQVDGGERNEGKQRIWVQLGRWRLESGYREELSKQWRKQITRDQEKRVKITTILKNILGYKWTVV